MERIDFSDWLNREMENRGWSQSELAKRAGLSRQAISDYINRKRKKPDENSLEGLAHAFQIPLEVIYRASGILPQPAEWTSDRAEWEGSFDMLTPEDRAELLEIARLKIERKKRATANHLKVDTGPLKPRPSGA